MLWKQAKQDEWEEEKEERESLNDRQSWLGGEILPSFPSICKRNGLNFKVNLEEALLARLLVLLLLHLATFLFSPQN